MFRQRELAITSEILESTCQRTTARAAAIPLDAANRPGTPADADCAAMAIADDNVPSRIRTLTDRENVSRDKPKRALLESFLRTVTLEMRNVSQIAQLSNLTRNRAVKSHAFQIKNRERRQLENRARQGPIQSGCNLQQRQVQI
jgi:hypothetical protein